MDQQSYLGLIRARNKVYPSPHLVYLILIYILPCLASILIHDFFGEYY